jgi:hypothetical protein
MLTAVLASLALLTQDSPARASGFRYEPGRITAGRVHRYKKSNRDGSNPSEIALYLASETRLEALKWGAGEPEATLVVAEMDWATCSVASFHTYHVDSNGERELRAELATSPDRKRIDVHAGDLKLGCALERFPWHSYDFDFASLNVALRFLTDPTGETEFTILDFVYGKGQPEFAAKGSVVLAYEGEEEHAGQLCRRYVLDGPGLEERGGSLWAAKGDEVFLVGFEIELPDEPGMSSGKLEWLRNETKAASEWESFVRTRAEPERR